jgi:outer membrane protein assembly factor BamB
MDATTGKEIWDSGKYSCRESIGISGDGKLVYIKNMTEGNVDAFYTQSADQELAWECKAELGYEIGPSPLVESGHHLFVPTATGMLIAINTEKHSVEWKHKVSNALLNSVLPVNRHHLLVSTMDGKIVCLEIP